MFVSHQCNLEIVNKQKRKLQLSYILCLYTIEGPFQPTLLNFKPWRLVLFPRVRCVRLKASVIQINRHLGQLEEGIIFVVLTTQLTNRIAKRGHSIVKV